MTKKFLIISFFHVLFVIAAMIIFDYQLMYDSKRYIAVANEFASFKFNFSPDINCYTAPGYPIFLAIMKPFTGHNMFFIAAFQSIFFIASLGFFLSRIQSKYNFSRSGILLLSGFLLFNPELLHLNGAILTESLAASLLLFICGSLVGSLKNRSDTLIFILCFSFLVLTKMEYLFLILIFIPFLIVQKKLKALLLMSVFVTGVLVLNGFKNKNTYGVFKPTSFSSGSVIYGGNNLNLDGSWHIYGATHNYVPDKYEIIFDSINKSDAVCFCIKQDSLYKIMAVEAWKKSYTDQLKVIPVKLGKQWLIPGSMDFYTGQKEIKKGLLIDELFSDELWPWYGKWKHAAYLFAYWTCLALSLIGLYIKHITYKLDNIDFLIISILIVTTMLYSVPFYGLGRFHLPVLSILFYYTIYIYRYYENKNHFHSHTNV